MPNPASCGLPRRGGADERGEDAAAEVQALPRRDRTEPSPRPDARPRPLPCSVQRAADESGVLSGERAFGGCCVVAVRSAGRINVRAELRSKQQVRAEPPRRDLRADCENATAPHCIMEPGWLVLLISLFVQMFFTVLASRPRLRLGDRREATWHALRPTHAKLCGAVGCAAAVQQGARLSSGSGAVSHRGAGGQVRSVGHARAQHLLLLVRRHRLACSPPPGVASTGSVPSHAWSHVRRAGTRSRG